MLGHVLLVLAVAPAAAVQVAVGAHSACLVTRTGEVWCRGFNGEGELGGRGLSRSSEPVRVRGIDGAVVAIAGGGCTHCAVTSTGAVWCWGHDGAKISGTEKVIAPTRVKGLPTDVEEVGIGLRFGCARTGEGEVWCWGDGSYGKLGAGSNVSGHAPPGRVSLPRVTRLAVSVVNTCALDEGGSVWCWGSNRFGQAGFGGPEYATAPVKIPLPKKAISIAVGWLFGCASLVDQQVFCWGRRPSRQTEPPGRPPEGAAEGLVELAAGDEHVCGRSREGAVRCWGSGFHGQLGDGSALHHAGAGRALLPKAAIQISGSQASTCAVDGAGGAWCWGFAATVAETDGMHATPHPWWPR